MSISGILPEFGEPLGFYPALQEDWAAEGEDSKEGDRNREGPNVQKPKALRHQLVPPPLSGSLSLRLPIYLEQFPQYH